MSGFTEIPSATRILGFAGRKQAGKDTMASYLKRNQAALFGDRVSVGIFPFAGPIKEFLIDVFGLSYSQCHGTEEDKNSLTHIRWGDLPHWSELAHEAHCDNRPSPAGPMTAREVMQHFGNEIVRRMDPNAWVRATMNRIAMAAGGMLPGSSVPPDMTYGLDLLAVIPDVRFPGEVEAIRARGGKVVRLLRGKTGDAHESETALTDDPALYDAVIDNRDVPVAVANVLLVDQLATWKWLRKGFPTR